MFIVRQDFEPVISVCLLYKQGLRTISMVMKDTIKEQEIAGARKRVYRDTHARILAEFLTRERADIFAKWDTIPSVEPRHVTEQVLDWVEGYSEPADSIDTETWATELRGRLAKVVVPDNLAQAELERHRTAVLRREESATPDDAEWLREELAKQEAATKEIADLLEPTS